MHSITKQTKIVHMKKLLIFSLAFVLLSSCGNQSVSKKSAISGQVAKSEVQKKTEHYMNTKSDLLHECENLYAVYKNDKFHIYMSSWNSTPVDTIYKSDVYNVMIQHQQERLQLYYNEDLMSCREEMEITRQRIAASNGVDVDLSSFEAEKRQWQHERDSINGIIKCIQSQPDRNEPYWIIYEFVEDVDRTFAVSSETDKAQYPCYCIYMPSTNELVTVIEKTKYSRPHVLHLLNMAL